MKLHPYQSKPAVVAIGRFSTPTKGHYAVIARMHRFIRTDKAKSMGIAGMPIVVIVDGEKTGQDKQKNPLTPDERIKYMQASGKADGVKFLIASDAMDAFNEVRKAGYEPLVIAAGSDRKDSYLKMLDESFTNNGSPITHYALKGLDRTNNGTTEVSDVSGTRMREAVRSSDYDLFLELSGLQNKPELAKKLYNKLEKVLNHGDA